MKAFKDRQTNSPILALADCQLKFILRTDASNYGVEVVLSHVHHDLEKMPVACAPNGAKLLC